MNDYSTDMSPEEGFRFFDTIHVFDLASNVSYADVIVCLEEHDGQTFLVLRDFDDEVICKISDTELKVVLKRENVFILQSKRYIVFSMAFVIDYLSEHLNKVG